MRQMLLPRKITEQIVSQGLKRSHTPASASRKLSVSSLSLTPLEASCVEAKTGT